MSKSRIIWSLNTQDILIMKSKGSKDYDVKLRQRAEKLLKKKVSKANLKLSDEEMLKLIYELEVHQVELELQNEELRESQAAATHYAERFLELFDFAPIGYLTLSKEGAIIEINHCASKMLERDRSNLINSQFGFFISNDTKPVYNHFLWKIFTDCTKETCEVTLSYDNKPEIYVRLTGIIDGNKEQCLVTAMDITDQKRAETELEKWAILFKPKVN